MQFATALYSSTAMCIMYLSFILQKHSMSTIHMYNCKNLEKHEFSIIIKFNAKSGVCFSAVYLCKFCPSVKQTIFIYILKLSK